MPDTAVSPSVKTLSQPKTKVERASSYLGLVSTTVGVLGAVGTVFVWLTANFYVGDIEVQPDQRVQSVVVKVYDQKGQEASFHTPRFQLMPGSYHLEITPNGGATHHADAVVRFHEKTIVDVQVKGGEEQAEDKDERVPRKKHWWQFWR